MGIGATKAAASAQHDAELAALQAAAPPPVEEEEPEEESLISDVDEFKDEQGKPPVGTVETLAIDLLNNMMMSLTMSSQLSQYNKQIHLSLVNAAYNDADLARCEQLYADANRFFALPKLRSVKLQYSMGKVLEETLYGQRIMGVELLTGTLVEIQALDCSKASQSIVDAFSQNVIFLTNLRHPGIRRILDLRADSGQIQAVMELTGKSIQETIQQYNGLEETVCKRVTHDILQVLEYCHLTNVTLNALQAKDIAFSAQAKLVAFSAATRRPGVCRRSHCYFIMPWSLQTENQTQQRQRQDLYALGQILIQMATTRPLLFQYKDIATLQLNSFHIKDLQCVEFLGGFSEEAVDFIYQILNVPEVTASSLLAHKWFQHIEEDTIDLLMPETAKEPYKYKGDACADSALNYLSHPRVFPLQEPDLTGCKAPALHKSLFNMYDDSEHAELFLRVLK